MSKIIEIRVSLYSGAAEGYDDMPMNIVKETIDLTSISINLLTV